MSKAMGVRELGGPEVLRLEEVAEPRPGPGEVRIRAKAAGVQAFDIAVLAGLIPVPEPGAFTVPGNEFAGIVDEVGEGVAGFTAGDEVLGFGRLGAYQELVVAGADQVVPKPPEMPWEVAGAFTAAAQTAEIAIERINVGPGDTVLVHGAAGSVGAMAVQLSQLRGAKVLGVARPAWHEQVRALGAIPLAYSEDFVERVAPHGVTAAIDGVGGVALEYTLDLVKDRSRILTLVEHNRADGLGIKLTVNDRSAARLARLAALYAKGELTHRIMATFPLAEAAEAMRTYQAGNIHGKIVLTMD
ncbi:NADP-dependent oxidoreductase [Amycolatopsis sp. CFH S0078]|uniref:quinone oxidoreductase family protein n=1 Tax=Amycolatopsis sp. CFH S0078 TaxID=1644108 RepID=UPI00106E1409|nr:NADP-dependent oxidoreductase [Amycolatopsis sp. CFH S0078]